MGVTADSDDVRERVAGRLGAAGVWETGTSERFESDRIDATVRVGPRLLDGAVEASDLPTGTLGTLNVNSELGARRSTTLGVVSTAVAHCSLGLLSLPLRAARGISRSATGLGETLRAEDVSSLVVGVSGERKAARGSIPPEAVAGFWLFWQLLRTLDAVRASLEALEESACVEDASLVAIGVHGERKAARGLA